MQPPRPSAQNLGVATPNPPRLPLGAVIVIMSYRKLQISRAPTKVKSQKPAYSQALNQNKIDRQQSGSRDPSRQQSDGVSRQLVYGHFVYDASSTDISSNVS